MPHPEAPATGQNRRSKMTNFVKQITTKEMAKHVRGRMKAAGIKARVQMEKGTMGLADKIKVIPPTFDARFTEAESRAIVEVALANRFTLIRNMPIDVDVAVATGGTGHLFEFHP